MALDWSFCKNDELTHLVEETTSIPGNVNHHRNIPKFFLTSDPDKYTINAPLGKFEYSSITALWMIQAIPTNYTVRQVWLYNRANWREWRDLYGSFSWKEHQVAPN